MHVRGWKQGDLRATFRVLKSLFYADSQQNFITTALQGKRFKWLEFLFFCRYLGNGIFFAKTSIRILSRGQELVTVIIF